MPTRWRLFAGIVVLVTVAFLGMARATERSLSDSNADPGRATDPPEGSSGPRREPRPDEMGERRPTEAETAKGETAGPWDRPSGLDSGTLLVDAVLSQLLVAFPLLAIAWYAEIPPRALGLSGSPLAAVLPGVAIGLPIYLANEGGAATARRLGMAADERLREVLAPTSPGGWAILLLVALPLIAFVEEFLFRAALIGGLSAGFGLPAWGLAVVSSVAFGLGHGLQGPGGVLVTGLLGFGLAAGFVLTGSLWTVVIAHYLVNALEFVVHEGLDVR